VPAPAHAHALSGGSNAVQLGRPLEDDEARL
jgi:hypothetical protein